MTVTSEKGKEMRPVFVVGNPRSGTTMLRLLIAAHGNICIPPECGFALWLQETWGEWSTLELIQPEPVRAFLKSLEQCRKFDTWNLDIDLVRQQIADHQPNTFSRLVECVYLAYSRTYKPKAKRWGDKNNFHTQHVEQINTLFPSCQFIHIVRDVRDVACSYRELSSLKSKSPYRPKLPFEVNDICNEWRCNVEAVLEAFKAIDDSRKMNVRYEDIVREPLTCVRNICDFLGEPYDAEMLQFHSKNMEPADTMDWKAKTKLPVSTVSLERFRSDLCIEDISKINVNCADLLKQFHYPDV